jgi:hypothetical protein
VVVTTGEDRLLLRVAERGKTQAIVSCYHQCSFWAMPGSYTLWATILERDVDYETTLDVVEPSVFKVSTGHPGARAAGLIAGIVGPLAMATGTYLGIRHVANEECAEPTCPTSTDYLPVVMLLSGLVTTIVGWSVFATTGPRVDEAPASPSRDPRPQLGVLSLPRGGWGVALSTSF